MIGDTDTCHWLDVALDLNFNVYPNTSALCIKSILAFALTFARAKCNFFVVAVLFISIANVIRGNLDNNRIIK